MKGIMGLIVIGGGIVMAFMGGYDLATLGSPPFQYEDATEEERRAYLQEEADNLSPWVKRSLVNPSGVGPSFRLKDTDVNTGRKAIGFNITVSNTSQVNSTAWSNFGRAVQERACPVFAKSKLYENGVQLQYKFMEANNNPLKTVRLSEAACRRYV